MPPELVVKLQSTQQHAPTGERRRVTMLFCDVTGSTAAAERLDPEEWAGIMNGAFAHMMEPIYRYEGTLARLMGDAVLAFFGAPIAHEDDPARAVHAGLEIQRAVAPYREEVRARWGLDFNVRVGINSGLVVMGAVGSDLRVDYTAMGDAVNVAARMEQTAEPGTVQVSGATHRLIAPLFESLDLGAFEVKGRAEPVRAYRVLRALQRPGSLRGIAGMRAPMIGRDAERGALLEAVAAAARGEGRIVSVIAEAGIGKSRLVAEAREEAASGDATAGVRWYEGRSVSYDTGVPYAPVRDLLRGILELTGEEPPAVARERVAAMAMRAGAGDAVTPYLAEVLGVRAEAPGDTAYLDPAQLRERVVGAIGTLIEGLSRETPLALVFEDLHWADSATIDVVRGLQDVAERAAVVLIGLFRPERDDEAWSVHEAAERGHHHRYTALQLQALDEGDARALVSALLHIDGLPPEVQELILQKAEGNPFFVEEVVRSLLDRGLVEQRDGRWVATAEVTALAVPDTLAAVLTTRLDQLDDRERGVTQAASVLGREFLFDELGALAGVALGGVEVDAALVELQRRDIVREVARIPRRRFRFKHGLLRDAVYETILLARRAELHGAVATALERAEPERVEDIAEHFVRARLPQRALPYLVTAGERAAQAYATPEAIRHLEDALALLEDSTDHALIRRALEALGGARTLRFELGGAAEAYTRLAAEGDRLGRPELRVSGLNKLAFLRGMFMGEREEALTYLAESEATARATTDSGGLIESCMTQCYMLTGYARFDQLEPYMAEVMELGQRLGLPDETLFGMTHFTNALVYLLRFDEAEVHAQRTLALAEAQGHAGYQAELLVQAIPLTAMSRGDVPAAVDALTRGLAIAVRIGHRQAETMAAVQLAKVNAAGGRYVEALEFGEQALAAADRSGLPML